MLTPRPPLLAFLLLSAAVAMATATYADWANLADMYAQNSMVSAPHAATGAIVNDESQEVVVYLVRHGEAEHNVSHDLTIPDPHLTPKGIEQAKGVTKLFESTPIDLIVTSPLYRTLETTMVAFKDTIERGVPVIALSDAQEVADVPADTGSPRSQIEKQFPAVNFDLLAENWYEKIGINAGTPTAHQARFERLRSWLWAYAQESGAKNIVLVGHHGVFRRMVGISFTNGEIRRYILRMGRLIPHSEPVLTL